MAPSGAIRTRRVGSANAVSEQVAVVQRARMLSAMVEVACERGAGSVKVAHVVRRSGVSRRTFYEMFNDGEDCFLASFDQALAFASERVFAGYDPAAGWRERVRGGLVALLSFLDEQPRLGRLLIVESLSGGVRIAARRAETIERLTAIVEQGRDEAKSGASLPSLTGEGVVGAVLSVLRTRLLDPNHGPLLAHVNELMSMTVLPYLGAAAARRELERPVPVCERPPARMAPLHSDPFKDAGLRITYRTVRVLRAVAEHPQASNREVGDVAEIGDPGQISKLLSRLERSGMLVNRGEGARRGAPNAWVLTDLGVRVVSGISTHVEGRG